MSVVLAQRAADSPEMALSLLARIGSAALLAPPVLAVIWFGTPFFELMVAIGSLLLAREWARMCSEAEAPAIGWVFVCGLPLAVGLAGCNLFAVALVALAAGAGAFLIAGRGHRWLALGILYIGVPCVLLLWLRADPINGRETVLWLFLVVWASDIGAYVAGRTIGGPKLAPHISPNKTWSGAVGGVIAASAVGAVMAIAFAHEHPVRAMLLAAVFSVFAQAGDLAESRIKRRFGVKDTGGLIPGHGGLLDRVDALLLAALAMGLLTALRQGSILAWI